MASYDKVRFGELGFLRVVEFVIWPYREVFSPRSARGAPNLSLIHIFRQRACHHGQLQFCIPVPRCALHRRSRAAVGGVDVFQEDEG